MMGEPIVFKKYANRRLYNTATSKHVTLSEISSLIRRGFQVKVIDAKSKEDVTDFILTQVVLEQAKVKNALLPAPLLHLIIRYGDNVLSEFFDHYLNQIIQNYLTYKRSADEQFQRWLDLGMGISETARKNMTKINPLASLFEGFSGLQSDPAEEDK
jgi:polyhydroxyalkanoate synthesis repressor PhaR